MKRVTIINVMLKVALVPLPIRLLSGTFFFLSFVCVCLFGISFYH